MDELNYIWRDIKRGENIDLYTALIVAVSLAFMCVVGVDIQRYIPPLTSTVLALLAYSLLKNRRLMKRFEHNNYNSIDKVLQPDWPDSEIESRIRECRTLFIVGPILLRTIKNYYAIYEEKLTTGAHIRALLVDPNSSAAEMIGIRPSSNVDVDRVKDEVRHTLKSLKNLSETTNGKLEFRIINYPLSYGGFFFNTDFPDGKIFIKYYPFKMKEDDRPRLVLDHKDVYWFNFYKMEAESLWKYANVPKDMILIEDK